VQPLLPQQGIAGHPSCRNIYCRNDYCCNGYCGTLPPVSEQAAFLTRTRSQVLVAVAPSSQEAGVGKQRLGSDRSRLGAA
jgi:hypothetical protein